MNSPMLRASSCAGCGRVIIWGVSREGTKIPLDPVPPVYAVVDDGLGNAKAERAGTEVTRYMVSHFATCRNANDFSRSKVKGREALKA